MKNEWEGTQNGKIILFPGTIERLIEQANRYIDQQQFTQANELFEQVYEHIVDDEIHLSVYTYSLYETKDFQRAREVAEQLLAIGPTLYFEAMELYLTICMQLREFKQVEKMIESLLEEGVIPEEQIEKFERLKELNADIADNKQMQEDMKYAEEQEDELDVSVFLAQPVEQQLLFVQGLMERNIRPLTAKIVSIIEQEETHPFIQSLLLVLLVEQQVAVELTVQKFGRTESVNPAQLELPTKLAQFQEISAYVLEKLEQEPSILELVQYLIAKHAIVTYPFEWLDYESADVAQSYIHFVKSMFGEIQEMNDDLVVFLQKLERISELQ
ncbi:MAG: DUF3196 domain-containing protein [Solibacillus sp.]